MKIVIAPDSYKESLSALEVATAIEQGFREIFPAADFVKLPVADGGEGTVEAMVAATQGRIVHASVSGPLGEPVDGFYGISGDEQSAFIEMAGGKPSGAGRAFATQSPSYHLLGDRRAYPARAGCGR